MTQPRARRTARPPRLFAEQPGHRFDQPTVGAEKPADTANTTLTPWPQRMLWSVTMTNPRSTSCGAPLEMVLDYLSKAAGFTIVLETEVKGKVDVWNNHPLTKDEAVAVLDSALNRNGYAAVRNGRTLTIMSRDEAKKRNIPVTPGSNPEAIPKTDEMVTQIIPVRYANVAQLVKDLEPLKPSYATLTANDSANALVLTDTRANVRRMVEIVNALDTSVAEPFDRARLPLEIRGRQGSCQRGEGFILGSRYRPAAGVQQSRASSSGDSVARAAEVPAVAAVAEAPTTPRSASSPTSQQLRMTAAIPSWSARRTNTCPRLSSWCAKSTSASRT